MSDKEDNNDEEGKSVEVKPPSTNVLPPLSLPVQVKPPGEFDFMPQNWEAWKARYERYLTISGHNNKDDKTKIDLFLYMLGDKAEQLAKQLGVEEVLSYSKVVEAFDLYFKPKRNVIYDRFKFNSRVQGRGESVAEFVKELYKLSEPCQYGKLKEELIRDRIVVGLHDRQTSERLQLMADLKLGNHT